MHGTNGQIEWLPFLERLSQTFDVLAPEHPGFGSSRSYDPGQDLQTRQQKYLTTLFMQSATWVLMRRLGAAAVAFVERGERLEAQSGLGG